MKGPHTELCDANDCNPQRTQRHPADLDLVPRLLNGGSGGTGRCEVDMGAYEFVSELNCDCPGDLTNDCEVGVADLLELLAQWGSCADCGDCPADLNDDCTVNVEDLLILLANWGKCHQSPPTESCLPTSLVMDCYENFFSNMEEFEECIDWVTEYGTPYPGE